MTPARGKMTAARRPERLTRGEEAARRRPIRGRRVPRSACDFTRSAKISPVPEHHHTPSRFDVRRRSAKPARWTSIGEFGESLSLSFQSRCRRRVVAGRARACSLESTSSVRVRVVARRTLSVTQTRAPVWKSSTGGNGIWRRSTSPRSTGTRSRAPTAAPQVPLLRRGSARLRVPRAPVLMRPLQHLQVPFRRGLARPPVPPAPVPTRPLQHLQVRFFAAKSHASSVPGHLRKNKSTGGTGSRRTATSSSPTGTRSLSPTEASPGALPRRFRVRPHVPRAPVIFRPLEASSGRRSPPGRARPLVPRAPTRDAPTEASSGHVAPPRPAVVAVDGEPVLTRPTAGPPGAPRHRRDAVPRDPVLMRRWRGGLTKVARRPPPRKLVLTG